MAQTFRVVLAQDKCFDAYSTREFDLPLDTPFPIGRSSSNVAKAHLMPAKHNAYIESPVVSRNHAILTAHARTGVPHVFLTDLGSMHGTFVNGKQLVRNAPQLLSNGDRLQLGVDVNRNENYYMAYEYTYRAELCVPHDYSNGISVPESEDDDVEVASSNWGSQQNPMTLDDSDGESNHSDTPVDDTTLVELTGSVPHSPQINHMDGVSYPKLPTGESYSDADDADDLHCSKYAADEDQDPTDSIMDDAASEPNSLDDNDAQMDSDAESDGSAPAAYCESDFSGFDVDQDDTFIHDPCTFGYSFDEVSAAQPQLQTESVVGDSVVPELPSFSTLSQSLQNQPVDGIQVTTLPPQPLMSTPENITSEKQAVHPLSGGSTLDSGYPYDEERAIEDPCTDYAYMETMADCGVPNVFSHAVPEASRMQTPPSGPISDEVLTTPPPSRRTGVSITEIIEQQPLTPTSVKSMKTMKRKADVFDGDDGTAEETLAASEVVASGSQVVNIDLRRPKRQPKSVIAKALKTASYLIPGAAVSFALLANLPDSFFGA